jgi:hypothetical protein
MIDYDPKVGEDRTEMTGRLRAFSLGATCVLMLFGSVRAACACYDVSRGEPKTLRGVLRYVIFPGSPSFQDVQKGDMPEPGYVLQLAHPICIAGDDFADPDQSFSEVQIVPTDATAGRMIHLADSAVDVAVVDPMAAETGHHHRPLVAWAAHISAASADGRATQVDDIPKRSRPPAAASDDEDVTTEYGTAATTVRAFYEALADGQGQIASHFVVREKRSKGPLSGAALTRFYGSLAEPLTLIDLHRYGVGRYEVRYAFGDGARACRGRSIVAATQRKGLFFIAGIQASDACRPEPASVAPDPGGG